MYVLGIDLGTTYTAAAVWRDGRAEICPLGSRSSVIPSLVLVRSDGSVLIGEPAARRALIEPDRVAREFKRRVGDTTPVMLGGSPFSTEALTARLLSAVVGAVTDREGGPPSSICVSHPANWGMYKTDLLREAVALADVGAPVTYTTEPEAAAVSYARQERLAPGETVAVYDLGGGTFDAAVLRRTATGFAILGRPEGIDRLGGIDIDAAVFSHVAKVIGQPLTELDEDDPAAVSAVARLRAECTEAKEALSADTDTTIPVILPNLTTEVRLIRAELEAMIRPPLYDSIEALKRALRSAGVTAEDLSAVLLVGGSSRIPIVAQLVGAELGRPVAVDAHPKHAIALGAAWLASSAALPVELDSRQTAGPDARQSARGLPAVPPSTPTEEPAAPAAPATPAAPAPSTTAVRTEAAGAQPAPPTTSMRPPAVLPADPPAPESLLTRTSPPPSAAPPEARPTTPVPPPQPKARGMLAVGVIAAVVIVVGLVVIVVRPNFGGEATPSGQTAASASVSPTTAGTPTPRRTPALIRSIEVGFPGGAGGIAFSPDGNLIAAAGQGGVGLWSPGSGTEQRRLAGAEGPLAFSRDGKTLASGADGTNVQLWNVATAEPGLTLSGMPKAIKDVAFAPNGGTVAASGRGGDVKLWDVTTGRAGPATNEPGDASPEIAYSPDGGLLATSDVAEVALRDPDSLAVAHVLTGNQTVIEMAFRPDGTVLATADVNHDVKLWGVAGGKVLRTLSGHPADVLSMAFSPDGRTLATSDTSGRGIRFWDVDTGRTVQTINATSGVLAWSPDGTTLAVGETDGDLALWAV